MLKWEHVCCRLKKFETHGLVKEEELFELYHWKPDCLTELLSCICSFEEKESVDANTQADSFPLDKIYFSRWGIFVVENKFCFKLILFMVICILYGAWCSLVTKKMKESYRVLSCGSGGKYLACMMKLLLNIDRYPIQRVYCLNVEETSFRVCCKKLCIERAAIFLVGKSFQNQLKRRKRDQKQKQKLKGHLKRGKLPVKHKFEMRKWSLR